MVFPPGGPPPNPRVHFVAPGNLVGRFWGGCLFLNKEGRWWPGGGDFPAPKGGGSLKSARSLGAGATAETAASQHSQGWIASGTWQNKTGRPITFFKTTWVVPPEPWTHSGQTIYLFSALLDFPVTRIYQPVLQWGPSPEVGGNYWAVASYLVVGQGSSQGQSTLVSTIVRVNVGDILVGLIRLTGQSGNQFSYECEFLGIPATKLTLHNVGEFTLCAEALEAFRITQCSDYPPTAKTAFTGIEILTGGQQTQLQWTRGNPIQAPATDCNQHVEIVSNASPGGQVDVFYSHWDIGFSGFASVIDSSANAFVWAYRASDGTVCIHQIDSGGKGFTQKHLYKWDTGFSSFVGFSLAGIPYVWAYKAGVGTVCIHQIDSSVNGFTQKFLYKWDTGFSGFAAVTDSSGNVYIWAYRASDGTVCIHQVNPGGNGFTQKHLYKWDTGFSSFVGFFLAGIPYVWAYKASVGTVCIHQIDSSVNGFTQKFLYKWDTGFSGFAAVTDSSGNVYIWAYRASDGTVCIHQINPGGNGFTQKHLYKWDTGFSSFVGFFLAGIPYVWAYKASV